MKQINSFFVAFSFLIICSCSNAQQDQSEASLKTECTSPRPEMCTMEYVPVCADKHNGIQCIKAPCPDTDQVTFSNGCSACADLAVKSYQADACEE